MLFRHTRTHTRAFASGTNEALRPRFVSALLFNALKNTATRFHTEPLIFTSLFHCIRRQCNDCTGARKRETITVSDIVLLKTITPTTARKKEKGKKKSVAGLEAVETSPIDSKTTRNLSHTYSCVSVSYCCSLSKYCCLDEKT